MEVPFGGSSKIWHKDIRCACLEPTRAKKTGDERPFANHTWLGLAVPTLLLKLWFRASKPLRVKTRLSTQNQVTTRMLGTSSLAEIRALLRQYGIH